MNKKTVFVDGEFLSELSKQGNANFYESKSTRFIDMIPSDPSGSLDEFFIFFGGDLA